jgi:cytochrome b561
MRDWSLSYFGSVPLPRLVPAGSQVGRTLGELHGWLIYVLIAFIVVHVLGAFVHLFVYKDGVMRRMLPRV